MRPGLFNEDEVRLDYGKKRATDCKHNTCVKLPGPKSAKVEEGIEFRRMTWKKIFWDFLNEMTDEEGVQESNLTKEEAAGLEKLKKKVIILILQECLRVMKMTQWMRKKILKKQKIQMKICSKTNLQGFLLGDVWTVHFQLKHSILTRRTPTLGPSSFRTLRHYHGSPFFVL